MKTLGDALIKPLEVRAEATLGSESPIEARLLTELLDGADVFSSEEAIVRGLGVDTSSPHRVIRARLRFGVDAVIVPQCRVAAEMVDTSAWIPVATPKRLRLDLAVVVPSRSVAVAVECDGHAYHDRTAEQAAADRSRDRALQVLGWNVARFTGTDINREAKTVAVAVLRFCEDLARTRREGFIFFSHPVPSQPAPASMESPPTHWTERAERDAGEEG